MVLLHKNKSKYYINRGGGTAECTNHCIILLTTMHDKLTMSAAGSRVSRVSHNVCKKLKKTGLSESVAYLYYFGYLAVLPHPALVV